MILPPRIHVYVGLVASCIVLAVALSAPALLFAAVCFSMAIAAAVAGR
jgi:hypothetical protein